LKLSSIVYRPLSIVRIMIDLHCHLLDETGCGPRDFAESLEICHQAVADGVRTIVATPRWEAQASEPPLSLADCELKLERLRREMRDALSLKLGFLVRFRADLARLMERYGAAVTLGGGRYVLVSLPSLHTPEETEEVWDAVKQMGFAVVVARPECSPALRRSSERLGQWVAGGVKLQLDAASITGAHGREVQQFAMQCVRAYRGRVVVASSACDGRTRRASLALAREVLVKKYGVRCAQLLLSETPGAILKSGTDALHVDRNDAHDSGHLSRWRALRPHKTVLNES
jgi:protein-tyrosine phosphatase